MTHPMQEAVEMAREAAEEDLKADRQVIEKYTPFEIQYAKLKQAKKDARAAQSSVARLRLQIYELEKEVKEAEREHKRAVKFAETAKEGLRDLFEEEMRNT